MKRQLLTSSPRGTTSRCRSRWSMLNMTISSASSVTKPARLRRSAATTCASCGRRAAPRAGIHDRDADALAGRGRGRDGETWTPAVEPVAPSRPLGPAVFSGVLRARSAGPSGSRSLSDSLFFWHLRTGESLLDDGIPHHDIFSFTAPGPRGSRKSWLAEVTYGILYRSIGAFGVRFFVGIVGVGIGPARRTVWRCGWRSRSGGGLRDHARRARGDLLPLVGAAAPDRCRSSSWCCSGSSRCRTASSVAIRSIVLPVLFWLWANTHGSFARRASRLRHCTSSVVGSTAHRPWEARERRLLVGRDDRRSWRRSRTRTGPSSCCSRSRPSWGDILSHITEWRSPDFRKIYGFAFGIWLVVYIGALARGRHRVSRRDLIVSVPMLFLAFWALRNVAIAPLIGLPVVARAFAREEPRHPDGTCRAIVVGALGACRVSRVDHRCAGVAAARLRVRDVPGEVDAICGGPWAARNQVCSRAIRTPAT